MKINPRSILKALQTPGSGLQTGALVGVVGLIYFIRAHSYLMLPQLFAEDGTLWLAQGYNKSVSALFEPVNGFLHVPERLFGFVVARLPLDWAPVIFALTAWGLFLLMAYYLFSKRTKILSNNYERLFVALSLGLIANFHEFFFNFSNSIFVLGIIGALIMLASKPRNRAAEIGEKSLFVLSSLTLPFAWFYLPIALVERFKYKSKGLFFLVVSAGASVIQLIYFLTSHVDRSPVTFFSLFSKYTALEIYNQMLVPALRFARIDVQLSDFANTSPVHGYIEASVYLAMILLVLSIYLVLRKGNKQLAYLTFFLAAMTLASIKSPTITVASAEDALKNMAVVMGANRYFVYGMVAVSVVAAKITYSYLSPRARYPFLAFFILFGLFTSLSHQEFYINKGFIDYTPQYHQAVNRFESGKIKRIDIPVNPYPWRMYLHQR